MRLADFPALEVLHIQARDLTQGLEREARQTETLDGAEWLETAVALARTLTRSIEAAVEAEEADG